jgi:hypothetical protein
VKAWTEHIYKPIIGKGSLHEIKNDNSVSVTFVRSAHIAAFKNTCGLLLMDLHIIRLDVDWRII